MQKAFKVGQSNEVIKSGHAYDLHNDYVPTAIVMDVRSNALRIVFNRTAGDDAANCALVFHEVNVLEFVGNLGAGGVSGLDEMGYKEASDYDYEWLSREAQSTPADHLVFRFDSGVTLRIHAASADLVDDRTLTSLEGRNS